MKFLAFTAAAFTAFAPAAFAMTEGGLTPGQEFEIHARVPTADLSNLTDAQVLALADAIHHGSGSESGRMIRAILN
ncbi:MAG: hypothetical protein WBP18_14325 [Paracoccaceae bacterium]|jgi:hypothetical protein